MMKYVYEPHQIFVTNEERKVIVKATFPFIKQGTVVVDHTYVDPSLRGQGIAGQLMKEVYDYCKKMNYRVVAKCAYAVVWFKKHQEFSDIIDQELQSTVAPECLI